MWNRMSNLIQSFHPSLDIVVHLKGNEIEMRGQLIGEDGVDLIEHA